MSRSALAIVAAAVLAGSCASAVGALELPGNFGGNWSLNVRSLKEARFKATVHQQYDFSCGSAALATLLTYHYNHPITEQTVFMGMYERGDQQKIRKEGFSLLDIKRYLEVLGYQADGIEASLDELEQVGVPALVLIRENNYSHFVVIKGIRGDDVLIGDPAVGAKVYSKTEFQQHWLNRIVFVIRHSPRTDQAAFNMKSEWADKPKAPLAQVLDANALANITLLRPARGDF